MKDVTSQKDIRSNTVYELRGSGSKNGKLNGFSRITFDMFRYFFETGYSSKEIHGQIEAVMSGKLNRIFLKDTLNHQV